MHSQLPEKWRFRLHNKLHHQPLRQQQPQRQRQPHPVEFLVLLLDPLQAPLLECKLE
jgi:hypothetical protein